MYAIPLLFQKINSGWLNFSSQIVTKLFLLFFSTLMKYIQTQVIVYNFAFIIAKRISFEARIFQIHIAPYVKHFSFVNENKKYMIKTKTKIKWYQNTNQTLKIQLTILLWNIFIEVLLNLII